MTAREASSWQIAAPRSVFVVLADIVLERERQESLGYTVEHDDEHGLTHILRIALGYARGARYLGVVGPLVVRELLVKTIATLVAAVEFIDRRAAQGFVAPEAVRADG